MKYILLFFSLTLSPSLFSNSFEFPTTIENAEGVTLELFDDPVPGNDENIHYIEGDKNLWERIQNGFAIKDIDNRRVKNYVKWYQSRPEYVERMIERSSR